MSLNYDASWDSSREGSPFSNNTEYEVWEVNWCDRCLRDAPYRRDISPTGCPLLVIALLGRTPAEWMEQPPDSPDRYHCIEFKAPGGGGSGGPRPKPDPRGMDELFPRPEPQSRMFVQPQEVSVS